MEPLAEYDIYVGRGAHHLGLGRSVWANPFKICDALSRSDAVQKYASFLDSEAKLFSRLHELQGKRLRCHCPFPLECHADVLVQRVLSLPQSCDASVATSRPTVISDCSHSHSCPSAQSPVPAVISNSDAERGAALQAQEGPFVLEVFCGHAGVSRACTERGLNAKAVDWQGNKHRPVHPVIVLDVTNSGDVEKIKHLARSPNCVFVWLSPPGGTFSAAREKPFPRWAREQGRSEPRPLRSAQFPLGLPSLTEHERIRVETGNLIATVSAMLAQVCLSLHKGFCIENPRNSNLWRHPDIATLLAAAGVRSYDLQSCAFGSQRDKWTRLVTASPQFVALAKTCPGNHAHQPWGIAWRNRWTSSTTKGAEYPRELCEAAAAAIILASGVVPRSMHCEQAKPPPAPQPTSTAATAASCGIHVPVGKQHRRNPVRLIPEYKEVVAGTHLVTDGCVHPKCHLTKVSLLDGKPLQPGAVCLQSPENAGQCGATVWKFGIPWGPDEFVDAALQVGHPLDYPPQLPDELAEAIFQIAIGGICAFERRIESKFDNLCGLEQALAKQEQLLHAAMPQHRAKILHSKRLLLLKARLAEIRHPDVGLVDEICKGFRITGDFPPVGVFRLRRPEDIAPLDPASLHPREWLWKRARGIREAALAARIPRTEEEIQLARDVLKATEDEVRAGFLSGPHTEEELDRTLGPLWVASRRFGVKQGGKVRPIDDLSESCVNATVRLSEKIEVSGIDDFALMVKFWHKVLATEDVCIALNDGRILKGKRHADFANGVQLLGKCADLESAYKQCPLSDEEASLAVIVVYDPDAKRHQWYVLRALPFGGTASVRQFNRVAFALRMLLIVDFGIPVLAYYDDFFFAAPKGVAAIIDAALSRFSNSFGWQWKESKSAAFAQVFKGLGVVFDLRQFCDGFLSVLNTDQRIQEICNAINKIICEDCLSPSLALQLAGRIGFAASQLFGRIGSSAMWQLRSRAHRSRGGRLAPELRLALVGWVSALTEAPPRYVPLAVASLPAVLFTDGFCDPITGRAGAGAVLLDAATGTFEAFGTCIPDDLVEVFRKNSESAQVVCQAELLPSVLSRWLWRAALSKVRGRRLLHFLDNDAARYGIIKGTSPSRASAWLLAEHWRAEALCGSYTWADRVPSPSNIADGPSRLNFEPLLGVCGGRVRVVELPPFAEWLLASRQKMGS